MPLLPRFPGPSYPDFAGERNGADGHQTQHAPADAVEEVEWMKGGALVAEAHLPPRYEYHRGANVLLAHMVALEVALQATEVFHAAVDLVQQGHEMQR